MYVGVLKEAEVPVFEGRKKLEERAIEKNRKCGRQYRKNIEYHCLFLRVRKSPSGDGYACEERPQIHRYAFFERSAIHVASEDDQ